ncbi:hypothetical protein E2C01_028289 [Portunus trituberculatus]|uniref:Uncharacterized protein n=1 Tax=Portunus trituberculatus TaxID=210409 RepID=A0A5B7ENS0_PORTR|nr:hypothetical protein [Portunus trituberculatus]
MRQGSRLPPDSQEPFTVLELSPLSIPLLVPLLLIKRGKKRWIPGHNCISARYDAQVQSLERNIT